MVARIFTRVLLCSFATTSIAQLPKIHFTGKEKVNLISTRETKNCFVSLVSIGNNVYLVKQKKDSKKQLAVVRDALSSYVARELDIAQDVLIVSYKKKFPGKIKSTWPATIHTLAPGETVRVQKNSKYNMLRLRQFWAGAKNFGEKGLTRDIITYMTWHKQLPIIVALDLLIGNSDRHCGNLCYDPKTDTFCAIDMDDTFNKDLCLLACKKIKIMLDDDSIVLTRQELKALQIMRNTLTFLIKKHTPKDIIEKMYSFATKAGFIRSSKIHNVRIVRKLWLYEKMITKSYKSARRLIVLLDTIILRKSRTLEIMER